jgi:aminoglycoside 3-N-acetyltransferase
MPATRVSLRNDVEDLGLRPGDIVMVHASVRSVGPVFGGPDEIHRAIVDAVSPGGAMLMYVGCPNGYDEIGRGRLSREEEAELRVNLPPFDPLTARADRSNGALAELFRSWPGTLVSRNVGVRMAARGDRAAWLVADHPLDFPHGRGTPFEKLVQAGGKVLLLGSDHDEVTLMHHAEETADFPDKIIVEYVVPLLRDGQRVWVACREVDSANVAHASWPDGFFRLIVDDFIAKHHGGPLCTQGKVGNSDSYLFDATALTAHAVKIMEQTAKGRPYFGERR